MTSMLTAASIDVMAERKRQIDSEGWTPAHDDQHQAGEMARAAACYAFHHFKRSVMAHFCLWPTTWSGWFKPTTPRRDLVKAAALILAEIERIDRAECRAAEAAAEPHDAHSAEFPLPSYAWDPQGL